MSPEKARGISKSHELISSQTVVMNFLERYHSAVSCSLLSQYSELAVEAGRLGQAEMAADNRIACLRRIVELAAEIQKDAAQVLALADQCTGGFPGIAQEIAHSDIALAGDSSDVELSGVANIRVKLASRRRSVCRPS